MKCKRTLGILEGNSVIWRTDGKAKAGVSDKKNPVYPGEQGYSYQKLLPV